jgi:Tol biopolymer transport system component
LNQKEAQLSPDQKWVAYVSTEAGPNDVFLTKFKFDSATGVATHGESIRISEGGGIAPRWRRDGKELLYLTPDGARFLFAVPVSPPPPFNVVQNWQAMSGR